MSDDCGHNHGPEFDAMVEVGGTIFENTKLHLYAALKATAELCEQIASDELLETLLDIVENSETPGFFVENAGHIENLDDFSRYVGVSKRLLRCHQEIREVVRDFGAYYEIEDEGDTGE